MKAVLNGGVPQFVPLAEKSTSLQANSLGQDFMLSISPMGDIREAPAPGSLASFVASLARPEVLQQAVTTAFVGAVASSVPCADSAISVACIPWMPQFWFSGDSNGQESSQPSSSADAEEVTTVSSRANNLQNVLSWTALTQALCGLAEFVLDDPLSGLIGGGIAALGLHCATPPGYRFLPTYVVLAFCNGTMQTLMTAELYFTHGHLPFMTPQVGLMGKAAAASFLVSPLLMLAGLVAAWKLHSETREAFRTLTAPPQRAPQPEPAEDHLGERLQGLLEESRPFVPFHGNHFRIGED